MKAVEKSQKNLKIDQFICMIDGSVMKGEGV